MLRGMRGVHHEAEPSLLASWLLRVSHVVGQARQFKVVLRMPARHRIVLGLDVSSKRGEVLAEGS